MANSADKFINLLVVFTAAIVAWLRLGTVVSPFLDMQNDGTVSVLGCIPVWKSQSQIQNSTRGWKGDRHNRTRSHPNPGFCHRLPADLSAAHLWNEHLPRILAASLEPLPTRHPLDTAKLLQFFTPSKYLELGHRSRPSQRAWGRLLEKIDARIQSQDAPPVQVVILGGGFIDCNLSKDAMNCQWPMRLEAFLNAILDPSSARSIVNVTILYSPNIAVTAELDTAVVKNQLWTDEGTKVGGPDVIVRVFTAQDSLLPKRGLDAARDIDYYHRQRQITQDFFRACLELQPCKPLRGPPNEPPLLIAVDEYVGDQLGPVMAETVQARVLQLLSDYYETAFVSYAEVIRKLVYASGDTQSLLLGARLNGGNKISNAHEVMDHGLLGPVAITLTLAYSFLRYTVDFCQDSSQHRPDYAMVKEDVFQLMDDVPPPLLNTDLCLHNITELWRAEKTRQATRANPCRREANAHKCALHFWGATHPTKEKLDEHLKNHLYIDEMKGWKTDHRGRLVATEERATLRWSLPLLENTTYSLQLFSVFKDATASPVRSKLQWELSPIDHSRRLLEQNNVTKTIQARRILQASTKRGTIDGTRDSPTSVVLPTTIQLDRSFVDTDLELKLQMVEGDSFEIVAMIYCSGDGD